MEGRIGFGSESQLLLSRGERPLHGPANRGQARVGAVREFPKNTIKLDKFTGFFDK